MERQASSCYSKPWRVSAACARSAARLDRERGNQESVVRAGLLGLPLVLAIIGGNPLHFAPLVQLYQKAAEHAGHDASKLKVASHSHGFVAEDTETAADKFFRPRIRP